MNNANKVWKKPDLTVLVRSNPEEAVLINCKTAQTIGPAAGGGASANTECDKPTPGCNIVAQT
jgi:hypothetical protein